MWWYSQILSFRDLQILRVSQSQILRISSYQILSRLSGYHILRLSDAQTVCFSDSEILRHRPLDSQTLRRRASISMHMYTIGLDSQIPRLSNSEIVRFS